MKISNEIKLGIVATIVMIASVWGYKFLKGQNMLDSSMNLYADFSDALGVTKSAPVFYKGVEIGSVQDITFRPENNYQKATLVLNIRQNPGIPKDAMAILFVNGVMGGRAINIEYFKGCNGGSDCAVNGDKIKGTTYDMLQSMIGAPERVDAYMNRVTSSVTGLMDTLQMSLQRPDNEIGKSLRDVQTTLANLRNATAALSKVVQASAGALNASFKNVESITANIQRNNARIDAILADANGFSSKLAQFDMTKVNTATDEVTKGVGDLKKTLAETQSALKELTNVMGNLNKGTGTAGQLLTNDELYKNLNTSLVHVEALMQDLRLNPRRYIRLVGKGKSYNVPSNDPFLDSLARRMSKQQ